MVKLDRIYWFIIVSVLLLLFDYAYFLKDIKAPFDQIILPMKRGVYTVDLAFKNFGQAILHYPQILKITEDNLRLQKINDELTFKVKLLTEENTKLRTQLQAPLPSSFQFIPADVISVTRFMELSVGGKDKVDSGMVVVDGISLIGKITKVDNSRSNVMLPNDPQSVIPAKTSRGTSGVVVGMAGGILLLDKVLQKDQLFLDDQVVTVGSGGYPPNLIIGKIVHISSDDVSPYKQAKLLPVLDYFNLKKVFIISSL